MPVKQLIRLLSKHKFSLLYLILIPLVNWAFGHTGRLTLPDGSPWSPFSIVVGLILVVRDFAQREIAHYIFIPLIIGIIISYFMAPHSIAIASATAFMISETLDWGIFTFTRAPFSWRVLISSIIGSIADSVIYLKGAEVAYPGLFSKWMLGTMLLSKFSGIAVVYYLLKKREREQAAASNAA